jgi:hypothetical protein
MEVTGMMKRISILGATALVAVLACARPAVAAGDLLFGIERTEGSFLGDDGIALDDLWIQGEFGGASSRLVVRVPYIRIDHTGLVTEAADAPIILGAGGPGKPPWQTSDAGDSRKGLGDVLVRSETYMVRAGQGKRPALSLIVDFKWATASKDNGLGTGEGDWSAGLDYVQPLSMRFQILGAASYRWMGSPSGVQFDNRIRLQAGFAFILAHSFWRLVGENVTPALSEVPLYDADGVPVGTVDVADYRVVRGEFVYKSAAGGSTRIYLLTGLNDSSPDLGFGVSFASRPQ